MGWKEYLEQNCANYKNFVLLGEAGSGKSEIALNLAAHLAQLSLIHISLWKLTLSLLGIRTCLEIGVYCWTVMASISRSLSRTAIWSASIC